MASEEINPKGFLACVISLCNMLLFFKAPKRGNNQLFRRQPTNRVIITRLPIFHGMLSFFHLLCRSYSFKRNGSPVGGSPKTDERPKLSTGKLFESQDLEKILVLLENEDLNVRVHAVKVLANLAAEESNQVRK